MKHTRRKVGRCALLLPYQSVAAVAIHDGVRATAAYEGTREEGLAVVEERLYAPLGANASGLYDRCYRISTYSRSRSVYGQIDARQKYRIPFLGQRTIFRVRAYSFQRDWAFYARPKHGWE